MERLLEKLKVTSKFTEDSEYLEGEAKQVEVTNMHDCLKIYFKRIGQFDDHCHIIAFTVQST